MNKVLFINSCVSKDSRTLRLAHRLLKHLKGEQIQIELQKEDLQPLNLTELEKRDRSSYETRYAVLLSQADTVVIAAPYYDLSFPSLLKIWIEMCCLQGVTFYYDEQGRCQSLCRAKKAYYVATAGGTYDPRFSYDYVKTVFSLFFGIEDVELIIADRLDLIDTNTESILCRTEHQIDEKFKENQV